MNSPKTIRGTKRLFLKLGTCSQLLFHVLNREFGHPKKIEERAADPLAGGIMQKGHQCGMLWGSALAVGAESFRRHHNDGGQAIGVAITATQHLMESFSKRTHSVNCRDITGCDWFRWMNTLAWHREAGNPLCLIPGRKTRQGRSTTSLVLKYCATRYVGSVSRP